MGSGTCILQSFFEGKHNGVSANAAVCICRLNITKYHVYSKFGTCPSSWKGKVKEAKVYALWYHCALLLSRFLSLERQHEYNLLFEECIATTGCLPGNIISCQAALYLPILASYSPGTLYVTLCQASFDVYCIDCIG